MFTKKQRTVQPYDELIPAFYTRVSSDEQAEATNGSLPDQVSATQAMAQKLSMRVYDDYVLLEDEKGSTLDRPQLTMLRRWIKERRINAVIVRSTDRLSRSPGDGELLFDEMRRNGVRFFVAQHNREFKLDDMNDRDMLLQEMMFNRRWLQMLKQTMDWGKRGRVERGNPAMGGGVKYGYRKWKDNDKLWHYELSDEATHVQSIFHWLVVERIGTIEIQKRLRGKPTPKDTRVNPAKIQKVKKRGYGEWSLSSIYSILRDPAYKGELTLYRDSSEYEPITLQIPAIVTADIWNAAQHILDNGKKLAARNAKHNYLLARLITCSCGASMYTDTVQKRNKSGYYHYYACGKTSNRKNYADPVCTAKRKTWHTDEIDEALWSWLIEVSEKPEILRAYLEESQQVIERRNHPLRERMSDLEATRKLWEQKLMNMLTLFGDRDLNDPRFKAERAMLERLRDEATQVFNDIDLEEVALQKKLAHYAISPQFIDDWCAYAQRVAKGMHRFTFEEKRHAIESLNITAQPVVEPSGRFLLLFISDYYAERIPLDSDSSSSSSEYPELSGTLHQGVIIVRIPLPYAPSDHHQPYVVRVQ